MIEIATSIAIASELAASTDTSTVFTVVTESTASQPPPVTVRSDVEGSTTMTPTKTKTSTIHLNRSTISSTDTVTVTTTVVPMPLGICATPGVALAVGYYSLSCSAYLTRLLVTNSQAINRYIPAQLIFVTPCFISGDSINNAQSYTVSAVLTEKVTSSAPLLISSSV
jgi:hypothetical protein